MALSADRDRTPGVPSGIMPNMPIERKLPLLIGILLLLIISAFSWASYSGVRRAVLLAADQRIRSATRQLADLLESSTRTQADTVRSVAADPRIVRYLRTRDPRLLPAARQAMVRSPGNQPASLLSAELRDLRGNRIENRVLNPPEVPFAIDRDILDSAGAGRISAGVGRLRAIGDTVVYPTVAVVTEGDRILGYLVRWRRLISTVQARQQIEQLIGTGVSLYLGNDISGIWTDLVRAVPAPHAPRDVSADVFDYQRPDGTRVRASEVPIARSPWVILLEFPADVILAPADTFLQRLAVAAVVLLIAGLILTWAIGRTISAPLGQLTDAAEAITAGEYSRRVPIARGDELGALAETFNTMAARIEGAQQHLEEEVRQRTAQLEERNAELEAFGYSISHDLRAPLRAMQGFSQALLDDYGDRLDETGRRFAQRVVDGAKRMDQLIRDLLAYSRVSRAEMPLAPVDLRRATEHALTQLEEEIRGRDAQVTVAEPLPRVVGNEPTLSQALANLIGNSIKFVAPDRRPLVRIRAERLNGRVRLLVEDNGIGIAPEHQSRIFGVFERLHSAEQYPGTGIGLAIVRKAAERMSGRVGVESRPGEGSRFWIELPTAEVA